MENPIRSDTKSDAFQFLKKNSSFPSIKECITRYSRIVRKEYVQLFSLNHVLARSFSVVNIAKEIRLVSVRVNQPVQLRNTANCSRIS